MYLPQYVNDNVIDLVTNCKVSARQAEPTKGVSRFSDVCSV